MLKLLLNIRKQVFSFTLIIVIVSISFAQDSQYDYKKAVDTFNKAWNTGNYILLDKVVHPNYFKQEGDLQIKGIESLIAYIKNWKKSLPDAKITYVEEVYGNEKAAIRFALEGTPVETGKKFKAEGIVIFRFVDGKIIEDKSVFDQLSSLQQQGYKIIPPAK